MRFFELPHLIILLLIILLIFGASKLPDIARNLGKSAKIIKEDLKELRSEDKNGKDSSESTVESTEIPENESGETCNCDCKHSK